MQDVCLSPGVMWLFVHSIKFLNFALYILPMVAKRWLWHFQPKIDLETDNNKKIAKKHNASGRKRVFMTGATGVMGMAALREFMDRTDRFDLTVLARPSKVNHKKLKTYVESGRLKVVWGDLLNADDVAQGVKDADFVLHVGGMVSPMADYQPELTYRVNTTAMRNIIDAVKSRPDSDDVGVVYVGSVAQYGPHNPPDHWGRTGDAMHPSEMDEYARSKVAAERMLSDSGLRKWVSLRQSGMLSAAVLSHAMDPIAFHVPVKGVLEWATAEDSGRLLANVCEDWIPDSFWQRFYNISSGPSFRLTNYEFEAMLMKAMGCPPPEKVFDVRWFATDNFHGIWYEDADDLEDIAHFRSGITAQEYFDRLARNLPWFYSLVPIVPAFVMKGVMHWVAGRNRLAPLWWLKHGVTRRINAHFGGLEAWESLPDWKGTDISRPDDNPPKPKYHGFDESKATSELGIEDMQSAARHRGGECLSETMSRGDILSLLRWRDADGNEFEASPASVLFGGHWGIIG